MVSLIAAANEEQFEKEYQKLLQGLEDLGLKELDQILDGFYQERCERYGVTLEKDYKKTMGNEMAK